MVYKKLNFSELICICQAEEAVATAGKELGGTGESGGNRMQQNMH